MGPHRYFQAKYCHKWDHTDIFRLNTFNIGTTSTIPTNNGPHYQAKYLQGDHNLVKKQQQLQKLKDDSIILHNYFNQDGSFPALCIKTEAPLRIKFNLFQCRYISPTTYTGKSSDTHHQLFLLWKSFRYTSPSIFYVKILPTHIIYTSIWLKKTDIWVNRYYRKLYRQYLAQDFEYFG